MNQKWGLFMSSLLLFLLPVSFAHAQTAAQAARQSREAGGQGYAFVAPGVRSTDDATLHFGGGGEYVFKGGGSLGAELGYLGPTERLDGGFGVFSANGGYHFRGASRSGKAVPFLTVGYAGFFRRAYANGLNYGGGVNYWFKEGIGLRLEFRDHVFIENGNTHFLNARIGLAFR